MPIRPDLKPLYGPEWARISHRLRFIVAAGRCEECRAPHGWYRVGSWFIHRSALGYIPKDYKPVKIILSAAHVNHDPSESSDENLIALCQRCHLRHDARHHALSRRRNNEAAAGQLRLFERQ